MKAKENILDILRNSPTLLKREKTLKKRVLTLPEKEPRKKGGGEKNKFAQVAKFIEAVKTEKAGKYNPANFSNKLPNSASGVRGVTQDQKTGKWVASISYNRKHMHLGTFAEFDDAVKARKDAEKAIIDSFGEEAERKREEAKIASTEYNRERSRNRKTKFRHVRDLSGLRFGKLTALYSTEKRYHGSVIWMCRCDCGNRVEVSSRALRSSVTRSCGCWREQDLEGQKFGKLTVLERTEKKGSSRCYIWRCRCDCGNETFVETCSLTTGNTKSCGCTPKGCKKALPERRARYLKSE